MEKPIPAFYCCYLLRSTVRHRYLYVGSTPNPVRRLKQHNGQAKGGAARTSRVSLQPWEMACIVTGFPSKIAALQFEWAWQNTHLTRHIPAEDRITATRTTTRVDPRTGKARKRSVRPQLSLTDRIANLHLLLRVKSFERWPLSVIFFAEDVHRVWETLTRATPFKLRDGLRVELEKPKVLDAFRRHGVEDQTPDEHQTIGNGKGIDGIDTTYESSKAHLEKTRTLLERSEKMTCAVCKKRTQKKKSILLVCPEEGCNTVSHMMCLSAYFLDEEGKTNSILPVQGQCPGCKKLIKWQTLMRELSLRMRGEKEVASLFKQRKRRAALPAEVTAATAEALGHEASSGEDSDVPDIGDFLPPSPSSHNIYPYDSDEFEDVDLWYNRKEDVGIDMEVGVDTETPEHTAHATVQPAVIKEKFSTIVIEDSDRDDAEVLD
ncbi:hypothetical protein B0J12DRAFT_207813 [Macrophomina phaseolina]|uniref:GIY-YIG domain-containing protein n=1 Tax=Macrophomina phaseolina TaxID=35725 RepID=A0ABQ8G2D4_9PEZI|nr:hypothetical protein B0J12DRAFT_207813 [Macrophomina phaseolina]